VTRAFHELAPSATLDAREALRGWRSEPAPVAGRPRVALNMIASLDGRITVDGRSGGLGSSADRELFRSLRAEADAVMAGARTVVVERYGPLIGDAEVRARRVNDGLAAQPLAVIVSSSLAIDPQPPLLRDADSHVVVIGASAGELSPSAATVEYIREASLELALRELAERFAVAIVVCEGGPTLAGSLFAAGLLDEIFITLAPRLVGGAPGPTFLDHPSSDMPAELELAMLLRAGDELFARYRVKPR
jgi:riboflavin-specific deaminase-like protein